MWQAGFHRTVLHNLSRDGTAIPSTSKDDNGVVSF